VITLVTEQRFAALGAEITSRGKTQSKNKIHHQKQPTHNKKQKTKKKKHTKKRITPKIGGAIKTRLHDQKVEGKEQEKKRTPGKG